MSIQQQRRQKHLPEKGPKQPRQQKHLQERSQHDNGGKASTREETCRSLASADNGSGKYPPRKPNDGGKASARKDDPNKNSKTDHCEEGYKAHIGTVQISLEDRQRSRDGGNDRTGSTRTTLTACAYREWGCPKQRLPEGNDIQRCHHDLFEESDLGFHLETMCNKGRWIFDDASEEQDA